VKTYDLHTKTCLSCKDSVPPGIRRSAYALANPMTVAGCYSR
jgi:hypothetical protein